MPDQRSSAIGYLDKYAKQILTWPSFIFLVILVIYPTLYLLQMAFSHYDLTSMRIARFNNLDNFKALLRDKYFWTAFANTLIISSSALVIEFVVGMALALLISSIKWNLAFKSLFIISMMIPPIVIGLNFKLIFDQFGPLNSLSNMLGFKSVGWLSSVPMARFSVILADVWQWTPFMFIIILAGLQSVPLEYYDAARVDGVGTVNAFLYITWPMILPSVTIALALRFIDALKIFDIIYMITYGGPSGGTETLSLYIYRTAYRFGNFGYASTMALIMLVFLSITTGLFIRLLGLSKRMEWK